MGTVRESQRTQASPLTGAGGGPRLLVPDVLRGVAILAMLVAHAIPFLPRTPGALRFVMYNVNDVASPLFALVMGMSAQLVTQRTSPTSRGAMLLQQAIRGLLLVALGLWMSSWGSWVAIVLAQLGILLVIGAPLVLLRTRWLAAATVVAAVAAAPLNAWARSALAAAFPDPESTAGRLAGWMALGAHYRVTNLLPFFLFGSLLLRHGFRRDALLWAMLAVAPLAYVVSPASDRLDTGWDTRSGSLPDTLHDLGLVFLTYVVVVLLATLREPRARRVVMLALEPVRDVGALALSLYVLHVGVLALWSPGGVRPNDNDLLGWLVTVPGTLVVAYLWSRLIGTGPVEWLMGMATGRRKPLRRASSR